MGNSRLNSGNPADSLTRKYLERIARDIGYKERDYTNEPIHTQLFKSDVNYTEEGKLRIGDTIVSIYVFNINQTTESNRLINRENTVEDHWRAVDWPIEAENGNRSYITFYFDKSPTKLEIINARYITKMFSDIERGFIDQQLVCPECQEMIHWTKLIENSGGKTDLKQIHDLVRKETCPYCCSDFNKVENANTITKDEHSNTSEVAESY